MMLEQVINILKVLNQNIYVQQSIDLEIIIKNFGQIQFKRKELNKIVQNWKF